MQSDPSFWQWVTERLWVPLMGLVAVWWAMLQARIRKTEKKADDAIGRGEFTGYVARTDVRLGELRFDISKIFDLFRQHDQDDRARHEQLTALIHQNHKEVLNLLLKREP